MATDLTRLPTYARADAVHVVIESPRGSTLKLKYEPALQAFSVSRPLPRGLGYPFDWGFIPGTVGPDGDPLDALVYWDDTSWPGVVLPCRPLGVLLLDQRPKGGPRDARERNDRLLVVPLSAARASDLGSVMDLSERERVELEHFFLATQRFEDKDANVLGWEGPEAALQQVRHAVTTEP
ncbi:inorganic diphosphatase [Myxococcaceae bacterium JPH2]|nr:inorganic diphosphatase [Myxococcaceae bacterium JPH2]